MEDNTIGRMLIEKGKKFYTAGAFGIKSMIAGIGLSIFICIISSLIYGRLYFFDGFAITAISWVLSIILIIIGAFLFPFYFFGLHYMGLGQICENTNK